MSIVKNIKNYINSKKVQRKQNEILKNTYERNYLFWGECEDSILVDNHNINYTK